jgi:hypothetical protein
MKLVESTEETHGNTILREKTDEEMREMHCFPLSFCVWPLYIHIYSLFPLVAGADSTEVRQL